MLILTDSNQRTDGTGLNLSTTVCSTVDMTTLPLTSKHTLHANIHNREDITSRGVYNPVSTPQ